MENKTPHSQAIISVVDELLSRQDKDNNGELNQEQFLNFLKDGILS